MKSIFSVAAIICICSSLQAGSGWIKKKGESYFKLNQFWVESRVGYFNSEGILDPLRKSSLHTTSLYGEVGTGNGISFEFFIPVYTRNVLSISDEMGNETFSESIGGFGDVNFGLKHALVKKDHLALSMSYMLSIPLGTVQGGSDGTLFTGDGDLNGWVRLNAGVPYGFGKVGGYWNANLGYNFRSQNFSNELMYGTELGISILESRFWIIGRLIGIEATKQGLSRTGIPLATNVSFLNYSIESSIYLNEQFGLSANYVGNISGSEVLITPAYNIGLFYDIK